MRIAILYIGTGRYTVFWKDFYKSCEKFFAKGIEKQYFFFTDSKDFFKNNGNLTIVPIENYGWPLIACHRYKILNMIKNQLKDFDCTFFFNGNMEFIKKVSLEELLPTEEEGGIIAPLHSVNKKNRGDSLPFERNPKSQAYVPYGTEHKYYHSGLLGGLIPQFLEMCNACEKMTDIDLSNNIIPTVHDESIFNKYILNHKYKEISNNYIFPPDGKPFWKFFPVKIIQRDKCKLKYGGHAYLRGETDKKITVLSYIIDRIIKK